MPIRQSIFKRYFNFDGKRFEIHAIRNTETRTRKLAESLRKRGFQARVIQYSPGSGVQKWAVYKRRAE